MNKYAKWVLTFIVVTHTVAFLSGYSDKNPARAEWLSVEKPPLRIIYVSQNPMGEAFVHHLVQHVENQPYRNYKFNEKTAIELNANAHQSDIESDSDVTSTTIKGN